VITILINPTRRPFTGWPIRGP